MNSNPDSLRSHPIRKVAAFISVGLLLTGIACIPGVAHSQETIMLEGESIDSGSPRMRVLLDLESQRHGLTVEQYRNKLIKDQSDGQVLINALPNFKKSLLQNDINVFKSALLALKDIDIRKRYPEIFEDIISASKPEYFKEALSAGFGCHFHRIGGGSALQMAINHESPVYLELLLSNTCENNRQNSFYAAASMMAHSTRPERILLIPISSMDRSHYSKAFSKAIAAEDGDAIAGFVNAGADIDHDTGKTSPLLSSIQSGQPKLSMWLMSQGASTSISNKYVRTALIAAVEADYDDIVSTIVAGAMDEKVSGRHQHLLLTEAMSMVNQEYRLLAIKKILEHGLYPAKSLMFADEWFFRAAEEEDFPLLQLFVSSDFKLTNRRDRKKLKAILDEWSTTNKKKEAIELSIKNGLIEVKISSKDVEDCGLGDVISAPSTELFSAKHLPGFAKNGRDSVKKDRACMVSILSCMNAGEGSDDCVRTVPLCEASQDISSTFCCSSDMKADYFAYRCSGESVWNTVESIFEQ